MRYVLAVFCGLLAGCATPNATPSPVPRVASGGGEWVVGQVRVVGSLPVDVRVVVAPAGASSVEVRGPLREEIRRLSGAEVAVYGPRENDVVAATDYQVRAVDGRPVIVGTVEAAPDGGLQLRTDRGEIHRIEGAEGVVRVGQKVWLQGPSTVRVQSHGVIRP